MKPMMQTLIGMDYERGLNMLKELVETGNISSRIDVLGVQEVGPLRMAGVQSTCAATDIGEDMARSMERAEELFGKQGLPTDDGAAVYTDFKIGKGLFTYIAGFQLAESTPQELPGLRAWSIPKLSAFRVDHIGCYAHLGNGWNAATQIARHKKLNQRKVGTFELYRKSPRDTDNPTEYETEIYLPLK